MRNDELGMMWTIEPKIVVSLCAPDSYRDFEPSWFKKSNASPAICKLQTVDCILLIPYCSLCLFRVFVIQNHSVVTTRMFCKPQIANCKPYITSCPFVPWWLCGSKKVIIKLPDD